MVDLNFEPEPSSRWVKICRSRRNQLALAWGSVTKLGSVKAMPSHFASKWQLNHKASGVGLASALVARRATVMTWGQMV